MKKSHIIGIISLVGVLCTSAFCSLWQEEELTPGKILETIQADGPSVLEIADRSVTPVQYFVAEYEPVAVQKVLEMGYSAVGVTVDNPQLPLDICMQTLQFLQLGELPDGLEYRSLKTLDILLQHGALPGDRTRELLPIDEALRARVVSLFEKHGISILSGENVCNDCCAPQ